MSLVKEGEIQNDAGWTEKLIRCVKAKPVIYNKKLKEHSDRKVMERMWNEVYELMFPTWNCLPAKEKTLKGMKIQQRWRNLRTCFQRELQKQKQRKSGQAATKRRRYVYFDGLSFLLPSMNDRENVVESTPIKTEKDTYNESVVGEAMETRDGRLEINNSGQRKRKEKTKEPSYEESEVVILRKKQDEDIDEDKHFLLSLVPSFKKLNDDQKLEAKMEFLSVIKRIRARHTQ